MKRPVVLASAVVLAVFLGFATGCSKGSSSSGGGSSDSGSSSSGGTSSASVSGTWVGSSSGSTFTLSLTQSGTNISGTDNWTSSGGGSGSDPVTGTVNGSSISIQETDTSCGSRTLAGTGTFSSTSMQLTFSAPAAGNCSAISNLQITFTKQ